MARPMNNCNEKGVLWINESFAKQTTEEISFLGSLEDSIFYSIARYFLLEINTVLPPSGKGN